MGLRTWEGVYKSFMNGRRGSTKMFEPREGVYVINIYFSKISTQFPLPILNDQFKYQRYSPDTVPGMAIVQSVSWTCGPL